MSAMQPYDSARREGGSITFVAELPAFAVIGRRYDELYKAYYEFKYPREHVLAEQAFVAAIEEARERAGRGDADWGTVDRDLEARYGEKYRRLRFQVPAIFAKVARASPAGAVQILDMLVVGARGALARQAATSDATEDPVVSAAAAWPPPGLANPLDSPVIQGPLDQ